MKKTTVFAALLMVSLLAGCFYGPPSNVVPAGSSLPIVTNFYATPSVITSGQPASLVWNVTGATSISINPGIGNVASSGSTTVYPYGVTTYTLTASNSYGNSTSTTSITVNPNVAPPVANSFTVSPTFINPGQSATLSWNVSGADSVTIDPGIGTVAASGSQVVSPSYTTTYILTATSTAGVITSSTILSVSTYPTYSPSAPVYPPYPVYSPGYYNGSMPSIISFDINPPVVSPGETTTMNWDVTGADTVSISSIGTVPPVGYVALSPSYTSYYTLTATNVYGTSTASASVTVYPLYYYNYSEPIIQNPTPFYEEFREQPGENERTERHERGKRGPITMTPPPTKPSTPPIFTMTTPPAPPKPPTPPPPTPTPPSPPTPPTGHDQVPRIESFSSSPPQVDLGHSTQIQWKVNGATSVNISPDIGPVPPSGTMTVAPSHTTVYTITASNSAGEIQHPQEVTVPRIIEKPKQ